MKNYILLTFLFVTQFFFAQVLESSQGLSGSQQKIEKKRKTDVYKDSIKIVDYNIFNIVKDTTFVDTSLTIKKDYKFNYLRKDEFGLMPFANAGQTYNSLKVKDDDLGMLPLFGARARHYNYFETHDINYYHVPTPLTELFFKTVFEQGQILDAFFTVNTSKQFNFSLAYKGMRSLGNYQNSLTSTGNLRMTSNYVSKNTNYEAKAHMTFQDLFNEENGGLTDDDLENFTSGDEDFLDRSVFDPEFQNAENILEGKRFFLDQKYYISKAGDSVSTTLSIDNKISFEDKYYQFDQTAQNDFFGDAFSTGIRDKVSLENFETTAGLTLENTLGSFSGGVGFNNFNYGYNFSTLLDGQLIPNRITGNNLSLYATYYKDINRLQFESDLEAIVIGDFEGFDFKANAKYKINDLSEVSAAINLRSRAANYNLMLYQSTYLNYNWFNKNAFSNELSTNLTLAYESNKLFNVSFDYNVIDNFSYFAFSEEDNDDDGGVKPFQATDKVSYFEVTIDKEFHLGNFNLDNKLLYQQVIDGEGIINIPDIVLRNSLYYANHFFKNNALYLQTGIVFNYFTSYFADSYDPLLAEFYTQNETSIGGFPRLDFFVNAKVRQTRIYLKAEHFNAAFTGYDYFSSPNYPYRDFSIRFGLVWNFFL